jgi:hypothetical protein
MPEAWRSRARHGARLGFFHCCKAPADAVTNEALDFGSRHAVDAAGFRLAILQQRLRDVVPVTHALLVGMRRAHPVAAIVIKAAGEEGRTAACAATQVDSNTSVRSTLDFGSDTIRSPRFNAASFRKGSLGIHLPMKKSRILFRTSSKLRDGGRVRNICACAIERGHLVRRRRNRSSQQRKNGE